MITKVKNAHSIKMLKQYTLYTDIFPGSEKKCHQEHFQSNRMLSMTQISVIPEISHKCTQHTQGRHNLTLGRFPPANTRRM